MPIVLVQPAGEVLPALFGAVGGVSPHGVNNWTVDLGWGGS